MALVSCKEKEPEEPPPLYVNFTPVRIVQNADSNSVFAVIEVPAGATESLRIDTAGESHIVDDRPFDFLPYPGNYGFIAGCGRRDSITGQLEPLPVLVMMHALATESMVEIKPIAALILSEGKKNRPVIVAVPRDTSLQSIQIGSFVDFITEYDAARHILQQWFLNYRGREVFGLSGWRDEHYARRLIKDWKLAE